MRRRIASIITAEPAALSVAPVPPCHESKWPPIITTSSLSAGSVPGISAITLNEFGSSSKNRFVISMSSATGTFLARVRAMRS